MSDEEIIFDILNIIIKDDDPIIYLYTHGSYRSSDNAINKALNIASDIFNPAYGDDLLKKIIIIFLNHKKKLFINGKLKPKPIY